jgi:glutamine synthetase
MNAPVRGAAVASTPPLAPVPAGTLAEAEAFLAAHPGLAHVDAIFVDLCGRVRGKRYPIADLAKLYTSGAQMPLTIYLLDVTGAMSDPCGRGFADGDPDGHAYPIAGRLMPAPWATTPRAQVLMTMTETDGTPTLVEPRNILRHVLERFAPLKLKPVVACEMEFYLIEPQRAAGRAPLIAHDAFAGEAPVVGNVYEMRELDRYAAVIEAIEKAAETQGLPASAASSEFAPGQFEINLTHTDDCIAAADHAALMRHTIISVARAHGLDATFLPKPFPDRAGSGLHVHMSLVDAKGHNVFADASPAGSAALHHAIGGVKAVMGDAMAIFASNLNAFRRYEPNLFVPVNRHWGINNRSTAVRVPLGAPDSRRIEHRVAGADSNPYLVLAAILAGVHHGLEQELDPGAPFAGNASGEVDPTLPLDIDTALRAFRDSALMRSYLTDTYVDLYAETKKGELATFRKAISPQEYDWYL